MRTTCQVGRPLWMSSGPEAREPSDVSLAGSSFSAADRPLDSALDTKAISREELTTGLRFDGVVHRNHPFADKDLSLTSGVGDSCHFNGLSQGNMRTAKRQGRHRTTSSIG